ncbi:hypothetical protein JRQ81_013599 [Phrynocephalus forsythii]|uniref:Uncharacterized protein n=1 Tax=Phrynocephalus forsythii TaxID=171643 RepID=A0A9Q1B470_9SAUR|nr:hypothetical protein JRQ81_013599 [Phrynocephalus forsythii]
MSLWGVAKPARSKHHPYTKQSMNCNGKKSSKYGSIFFEAFKPSVNGATRRSTDIIFGPKSYKGKYFANGMNMQVVTVSSSFLTYSN